MNQSGSADHMEQAAPCRVAVVGAQGRMGQTAVATIEAAPDMQLVAALGSGDSLQQLIEAEAQVVVELTVPQASEANVRWLVEHNIHAVVGTSGWNEGQRSALTDLLREHPQVGVLIAPNFALGSVLASHFAAQAAPYFESVEIIELHHPQKVDAPSGTAVRTAQLIADARTALPPAPDATEQALEGARGTAVEGIPVHSVRLAGLTAHQEVLLGGSGEQLVLRHDSFGRESFKPGIRLGIREVAQHPGLSYGLDAYLNLGVKAKS